MSKKISRGELYFADLSPVKGSEQGGCRPVLVIQNNEGNRFSATVIVAALSGQIHHKGGLPTHHIIRGYPGLKEDSVILLEQIRTVDKRRLRNYIGTLSAKDMAQVNSCLSVSLGLDKG
ncbi:MAG: type II toxin-antitoxin system PemK/MazF family toxin [Dorea sp.]|nr:type II toxin-antitoxin system PemK/MazF family toxin [Dorea sp.]